MSTQLTDDTQVDLIQLRNIVNNPNNKEYAALRHRAAYMYITGSFPTHLRTRMTTFLRLISEHTNQPSALDGRSGALSVTYENIESLKLESHPMVIRVRKFLDDGWKIFFDYKAKQRRPYSRVRLYKTRGEYVTKAIVQSDGSVLDGWNLD
ncbi:hypothetical protein [Roseibium sp. RKSG952]|uniref:hypothetical protein n=1 Tax=Roseibium sp. RKSG952 TaxID=2529384 RepID=UPI0012BC49D5|nr:hypothetical protein [Roseibium sp. RKSG952]MTH94678.1 hypothetical protein [Roseibium sp. RKSG952]